MVYIDYHINVIRYLKIYNFIFIFVKSLAEEKKMQT